MKRLLIAVAVLLAVLLAATYLLIPASLKIHEVRNAKGNAAGAYRYLSQTGGWTSWWPGQIKGAALYQGERQFTPRLVSEPVIAVQISSGKHSLPSALTVVPSGRDSLTFAWTAELPAGKDPFTRISRYLEARELKATLQGVMDRMAEQVGNPEIVYGLRIEEVPVTDTLLVMQAKTFDHYPTTLDTYMAIGELGGYMVSFGEGSSGHPMVNLDSSGTGRYFLRVALPIVKNVPANETFEVRRMVRGFLLKAEVQGGEGSIRHARQQIENYMTDYKRNAPAIPFVSYVTDRPKQPDSSKWISVIYYPVY